jgi:hypothetical protein
MMVKNTIVEITRADGKRVVYIAMLRRPEMLAPIQHKLRVKSVIYGCVVSTYCPGMCFNKSIEAGGTMTVDNRAGYVHDVKIVPVYSKKEKKDKRCMMCGQPIKK